MKKRISVIVLLVLVVIIFICRDTKVHKFNMDINENLYIDIVPILQEPELPTGCEITSLATVFNYYGMEIDKTELAEKYLEVGDVGQVNPNEKFVGTPFDKHSFGCYADVIENAANKFIKENRYEYEVINLVDVDMNDLKLYIDNDIPVIIWTTIDLLKPYESVTWQIDGNNVTWLANEHCVVLIGYDKENYIVSDPLHGICEYPGKLLEKRYSQMGKQAIVIRR